MTLSTAHTKIKARKGNGKSSRSKKGKRESGRVRISLKSGPLIHSLISRPPARTHARTHERKRKRSPGCGVLAPSFPQRPIIFGIILVIILGTLFGTRIIWIISEASGQTYWGGLGWRTPPGNIHGTADSIARTLFWKPPRLLVFFIMLA